MKNKYERLSKKEKKEARDNFKNSENNKNKVYEKLTRLKVFGIIGFIYGLIMMLVDLFIIIPKTWIYFYDGVVIAITFFAYFKAKQLLDDLINSYLIEESKKKNKK